MRNGDRFRSKKSSALSGAASAPYSFLIRNCYHCFETEFQDDFELKIVESRKECNLAERLRG